MIYREFVYEFSNFDDIYINFDDIPRRPHDISTREMLFSHGTYSETKR